MFDRTEDAGISPVRSELQQRAKNLLDALPFEQAQHAGYSRGRAEYFLNITYPSLQVMGRVTHHELLDPLTSAVSGSPVALYVHIPFCTAQCAYCHYFKEFHATQDRVEATLSAIRTELKRYHSLCGTLELSALYVGGGTPSYLTERQIDDLFDSIDASTRLTPGAEISFEVHPESATVSKLDLLASRGVSRVSIGVESLDDILLKRENRRHTRDQAIAAYHQSHTSGIQTVNLDLIYGLRDQFPEGWEITLDEIADLRPDSVTTYYMRLRSQASELAKYHHEPHRFASEAEMHLMHGMTFQRMVNELDYVEEPVDWFSRRGVMKHSYQDFNWRQTDSTPLIGIGPSAYSYVNGWQYYNINDIDKYMMSIAESGLGVWRGEHLSQEDRLRRAIVLGLKVGIDLKYIRETFDVDFLKIFAPECERLLKLDLVTVSSGMLSLTMLGRLLADEVGQTFYSADVRRRMSDVEPALISTTSPRLNYD